MAHKKGGGSSRNGRDSNGQRLGLKKYAGEFVLSGNIIVRQHGSRIKAGENVMVGKDWTIFAVANGIVVFETLPNGQKRVSVTPAEIVEEPSAARQRRMRCVLHLNERRQIRLPGGVGDPMPGEETFLNSWIDRELHRISERDAGIAHQRRGEAIVSRIAMRLGEFHRSPQRSAPGLIGFWLQSASAIRPPALDTMRATPRARRIDGEPATRRMVR